MSEQATETVVHVRIAGGWKTTALGIVILLAGAAIGAGVMAIVLRPWEAPPPPGIAFVNERTMEQLRRELELRPEQVDDIRAIFDNNLKALNAIREEARPKIAEQMDKFYAEVMGALDAEQQVLWRDRIYRLRNNLMEGPGGPGPGGPGGRRGPGPHWGPPEGVQGGPRRGMPRGERPFRYWQERQPGVEPEPNQRPEPNERME
jgi:hypothetical protein